MRPHNLKQIDITLSLLLLYPLPIETALKMAKILLFMHENLDKREEYEELLLAYYRYASDNKAYRKARRLEKELSIQRPAGRVRDQIRAVKHLIEISNTKDYSLDGAICHNKKERRIRLSPDYYFDNFEQGRMYKEEVRTAVQKFFSMPFSARYFIFPFNTRSRFEDYFSMNVSIQPVARVDEIIETIIAQAIFLYGEVSYHCYHVVDIKGFRSAEQRDTFKSALAKLNDAKDFDAQTLNASKSILGYYSARHLHKDLVPSISGETWPYLLILGKMLSNKPIYMNSYTFNAGINFADDFRPESRQYSEDTSTCPSCTKKYLFSKSIQLPKPRIQTHWREFCETCRKFASDEELFIDKETKELLDAFYQQHGMKHLIKKNNEKYKKEKIAELLKPIGYITLASQ